MGFLGALQLDAACRGRAAHQKQKQQTLSLPSAESVAAFVATTLGAPHWPKCRACSNHASGFATIRTSACRAGYATSSARCSEAGQP